jgi:hypothetical protein
MPPDTTPALATACNPQSCPLCQQPNRCTMAAAQLSDAPCWCTTVRFSPQLLAQVPAGQVGRACICAACAARSAG